MKFQSVLIALIFASTASVAAARETKIGSTIVTLTPPQGQCELGNEKGNEATRVKNIREILAPQNQLLATYANCDELAKFRSGDQDELENFSHYTIPTENINKTVPADGIAQVCAILRTHNDDFVASLLQGRAQDIE